jgi:hypothetical protein
MEGRYTRLAAVAKHYGETLDKLIPRIVAQEGGYAKAAIRMTIESGQPVYPNALRNWASKNGYQLQARRSAALIKVS